MTKEALEIIKKTDIRSLDAQLALRCAPFIAGLKPSNLLITDKTQADTLNKLLKETRFSSFLLYECHTKMTVLLYAHPLLDDFINSPNVRKILYQQGYANAALQNLLKTFAARYQDYMQRKTEFPHEMGLFLGYPPEDVEGFIANKGKNCIYAGYWKVYANPLEKMYLFQKFDQAKEALLRLSAQGFRMCDLLKYA